MAEASVLLFFWTTVMIWSLSFAGQKAYVVCFNLYFVPHAVAGSSLAWLEYLHYALFTHS